MARSSRILSAFCAGLVNLVYGEHHRHVGRLRVGYGLASGGHHAVVGRDDDDGNVGNLRSAGAHRGERFVSRGVEEGYLAPVGQRHVVRSDMLRYASGLAGYDVGVADMVEQRCLTVVYVAHHCDDGGARLQVVLVVRLFRYGL